MRTLLGNLERLRGPFAVEQTLAELPSEVRDPLTAGAVGDEDWIPVAWFCSAHAAAQRATGSSSDLARALGYEGTLRNFSGPHRPFVSFRRPEDLQHYVNELHGAFYDRGSLDVVALHDGSARVRWSGCVGFDRNIWLELLGSGEALLELCGADGVRSRFLTGGTDEDAEAECQLEWRAAG